MQDPRHAEYLERLPFLKWATVQEPVRLFEAGNFKPADPYVAAALEYLQALFKEYFNSFGNENGFCDIRDNERRGAKHTQRSDGTLHALAISSMATRWTASEVEFRPELVTVEAEDVSASKSVHVAPETYRAGGKSATAEALGFNPGDITSPDTYWHSTSTDRFSWAEVWARAPRVLPTGAGGQDRTELWPGKARARARLGEPGKAQPAVPAETDGGRKFNLGWAAVPG